MQFGSVEFFKVLIKTVLCILFFVPLVLCVVFAVLLWNSNQKQAELAQDNQKLEYYAEILSGEITYARSKHIGFIQRLVRTVLRLFSPLL